MQSEYILLVVLAAIVSIGIATFHYYKSLKNKEKVGYLLAFLRSFALFLVFVLLINPKIEQTVIRVEKPCLVMAVDNSSSIKNTSHYNEIVELLERIKSNEVLNEKFQIDYFSFGDDIQVLDSLNFDKNQTNISKPLQQIKEIYKNKIAPVILITDGNQTVGTDYEYLNFNNPIYPIIVGDTTRYSDLSISQLNANKYAYLKNKFPIEVFLNYEGEDKVSSTFSIYKGNQKVYSKLIDFSQEINSRHLSFHLPTTAVGIHYYTAEISSLINEKNILNNKKSFVVEVIDEQAKILVLTSFLHPDVGALKKAIESNEQRKVDVKIIGDEFNFQDYQSLIYYQPTRAFNSAFIDAEDQNKNLFIITGSKTNWSFLNSVQDNFTKAVINQTENYNAVYNQSFGFFVTRDIGFDNFPPLKDNFGMISIKVPFENLLNQKIGNIITDSPLISIFEIEDRRFVALFGENIWRWRMTSKLENSDSSMFDNFIGSLMQYLADTKKSNRLEVDYKNLHYSNEEIRFVANYLDKNYNFDKNAVLWVTIKNSLTNEITKYPFSNRSTSYIVQLSGLTEGNYSFTVSVEEQDIAVSGKFKILNFNVEQQFTSSNFDKLQRIATTSKGTAYFLDKERNPLDNLVDDPRFRSIQKTEKKQNSLVDWKWLLGLIILSLSFEWFIRKYNGLI